MRKKRRGTDDVGLEQKSKSGPIEGVLRFDFEGPKEAMSDDQSIQKGSRDEKTC